MMAGRWTVSIFFALISFISSSRSLEYLYNPSMGPVSCGQSDDCYVHCNGSSACKRFDFYFYNNNVTLRCDGLESCYSAEIHINNTTDITLYFNGESAFEAGALWANTDADIHTVCNAEDSCARSSFWYHGVNSAIIHECNDVKSCYWGMISAVPNQNTFTLNAPVRGALTWESVFLPNDGPSYLNLNSSGGGVYFYSLYGTTNIHPTCVAGGGLYQGTALSCNTQYTLLYTNEFHEYCALFNCSDADIPTSSYSNFDILYITDTNRFDYNLSYSDYSANGRDLMVFLTRPETMHPMLLPPLYSSSDNKFVAVCVEGAWSTGCRGRVFDFRNARDATVVYNTKALMIYGPKNQFKMFTYVDGGYGATYYLTQTDSITIECWGSLGCLGHDSKLYIGNNTDLTINCGSSDCTNSMIYSTLNPLDFYLEYLWDIQCTADTGSCVNLIVNFTEYGHACNYSIQDPCVQYVLGTPSPTLNPTVPTETPSQNPTTTPTDPSKAPTENPTTTNPTEAPTRYPSWDTMEPTPQPSPYPSHTPFVYTEEPTPQDVCYSRDLYQEKWEGSTMEDCTFCMCDERFSSYLCEKTSGFIDNECETGDCGTVRDSFMNTCFPSDEYSCSSIEVKETCEGQYCFECSCSGFYCDTNWSGANTLKWLFSVFITMLFMFSM
eukprot:283924_1